MRLMIIFTTVRGGKKNEFGTEFKNEWKLSNFPWESDQKISDSDRRLIVYDGKTIWDNEGDNKKYFNTISKICKERIKITESNEDFLVLIHTNLGDYVQKIKEELVNLENTHICTYSSAGTGKKMYEDLIKLAERTSEVTKNSFNLSAWQVRFDDIWNGCTKDMVQKKINEILYLFLPLDIDMQALEILAKKKENGVRVKDPKEYLEEMYADNIDYVQKLKELQAKVNTIGEIEEINKERLKKLAGTSNENVDQFFFKKLGGKKNDPDEFLGHSWGIDGVNSFHDWYCALALCLSGAEGCEGK